MYPAAGPLNKPLGRELPGAVGPVSSWHLTYSKEGPTLAAATPRGTYLLSKPDTTYRKVFASLDEQAKIAWHVLLVSWGVWAWRRAGPSHAACGGWLPGTAPPRAARCACADRVVLSCRCCAVLEPCRPSSPALAATRRWA